MNTILLQKSCQLYFDLNKLTAFFPKRDRYDLGLKIDNSCLELIELVIEAEQILPVIKDVALIKAHIKAEFLKIILRITMEKKLIKETNYFDFSGRLIEIIKMINGWRKSIRQNS